MGLVLDIDAVALEVAASLGPPSARIGSSLCKLVLGALDIGFRLLRRPLSCPCSCVKGDEPLSPVRD